MFDNIFATESGMFAVSPKTYLIAVGIAFACGIVVAVAATLRSRVTKSFLMSLILLPPIVATVILMVNGNVGTGIAVAGAFSLVRFRSVPGRAKEIAAIFLVMTAGLACGAGYVMAALLFAVITAAAYLILSLVPMASEREWELRITVPESLSYYDAVDDLFAEYARRVTLASVKTTGMGSLYKLRYRLELKDKNKSKELIDKLRCRNGNLEISLTEATQSGEEL